MLEPMRQRIKQALLAESGAVLATRGPGGIQAGFFPCEADGLTLYLLVPASADVVFNLETDPDVVVTTPRWQVEGKAIIGCLADAPPSLNLVHTPRAAGCVLVTVGTRRFQRNWTGGWGYEETVDL